MRLGQNVRMGRHLLTVVACCLVLMGCVPGGGGAEPTVDSTVATTAPPEVGDPCEGQSWQSMEYEGDRRRHLVKAPASRDGDQRFPVIYFFHGLGGQADTTLAYSRIAERADELGYMVVAPQAIGSGSQWDYRTSADEPGSDLAYARELMGEVADLDCVDPDRQYAAGLSNGSILVFAMACSGEFPVKAYGGVAAAFYDSMCDAAPPASIVYFHGTADPVVPFDGGETPLEPVEPVSETLEGWAAHNGCGPVARTTEEGEDVEHLVWPSCGAHPLQAYLVEDGGHTWPGAPEIPSLGETTQTVDAAEVMLEFFGISD